MYVLYSRKAALVSLPINLDKQDLDSDFTCFVSSLAYKQDSDSHFTCFVSSLTYKQDSDSHFICFVSSLAY